MGTELWNVVIRVMREIEGKMQGVQMAQMGGRVLKGMLYSPRAQIDINLAALHDIATAAYDFLVFSLWSLTESLM